MNSDRSLNLSNGKLIVPVLTTFGRLTLLVAGSRFLPSAQRNHRRPLNMVIFQQMRSLFSTSLLSRVASVRSRRFVNSVNSRARVVNSGRRKDTRFITNGARRIGGFYLRNRIRYNDQFIDRGRA